MVRNPRRYCECIPEEDLHDMFCEEGQGDPEMCTCPDVYEPVTCGIERKKYDNQCRANCEGERESFCTPDIEERICPCPKIYAPVTCGNERFNNRCLARCAGHYSCQSASRFSDFGRRDFTEIVNFYDNEYNRPTGLVRDERKQLRLRGASELETTDNTEEQLRE